MKFAVAQMAVLGAAPKKNYQEACRLVQEAKTKGAAVVILPQLALSGTCAGDNWQDPDFADDCLFYGEQLAKEAQGIDIIFGNVAPDNDEIGEACYLARGGQLQLLPAYIIPEQRGGQIVSIAFGGQTYRALFVVGEMSSPLSINPQDIDLLVQITQAPLSLKVSGDRGNLARAYKCKYIYANSCTLSNTGKTFWLMGGGSAIYNAQGQTEMKAPFFADGLFMDERVSSLTDDEKVYKALVFGAKNFMASINCSKAVIGLSGGIDSALAACVYTEALGGDNVLLINMPSCYNSDLTKNLSHELAKALKTHYVVMPIQQSLEMTIAQFKETPISSPDGSKWTLDITTSVAENIQARDRSARILAAAAAAWDGIYTCNGNKAELTVGYATFCGDLSGALALTADLWKHQVYQASAFAGQAFPEAAEYLNSIASIRPSAELSENQSVDEGKGDPLMYPYHDYLLRCWVEGRCNPADVLKWYIDGQLEDRLGCANGVVNTYFANSAQFVDDLEYWWKMYRGMGVAKRLQSPPLLALSDSPFGDPRGEIQGAAFFSRRYQELKKSLK